MRTPEADRSGIGPQGVFLPPLGFLQKIKQAGGCPSSSPALSQTNLILRRFFDKMGLDAVHTASSPSIPTKVKAAAGCLSDRYR